MDGFVAGKSVLGWKLLLPDVKLLDDNLVVLHGSVVAE